MASLLQGSFHTTATTPFPHPMTYSVCIFACLHLFLKRKRGVQRPTLRHSCPMRQASHQCVGPPGFACFHCLQASQRCSNIWRHSTPNPLSPIRAASLLPRQALTSQRPRPRMQGRYLATPSEYLPPPFPSRARLHHDGVSRAAESLSLVAHPSPPNVTHDTTHILTLAA